MKVVWRFAATECGVLCVMTFGVQQMHRWCVDNWDIQQLVRINLLCSSLCLFYAFFFCSGARAFSFAFFGQGTGPILIDDVRCLGTESRLFDCTHSTTHNCIHFEDAGARCQGCRTGDIRLVGGSAPSEGRVEVCQVNVWGTVCDDFWGTPDATVVCRQLGYSTVGAVARSRAFFGQGTGTIFLDDVMCTGTEAALSDCPATATHNCQHSEDAGVTCVATRKL